MKVVCAASVLQGAEAFAHLGEVAVLPDGAIGPADVAAADALIVRSKTPVTRALLEGSRVQFVGTATSGYDHLDVPYLEQAGIAWAYAAGSNANSVAEYVVAALLHLARRHNLKLAGRTLGVVGVGHIGRRVAELAELLGMRVLRNDPPLSRGDDDPVYRPLGDILPAADIITFHVPLTQDGPCPTRHLADYNFFARLKPGGILINAARGPVVQEEALLLALERDAVAHAVLDTWEHEPRVAPRLLESVDLATPHIAGYSLDGKLNGTVAAYHQACNFFEIEPAWQPAPLPLPAGPVVDLAARGRESEEVLQHLVRRAYDIRADNDALRAAMDRPSGTPDMAFNRLREQYPARREFPAITVRLADGDGRLERMIAGLGFRLLPASTAS